MPIIRVSVSEAAKLFGVSTRTVRRAIEKQEIRYVVVQGRYKLNFEDLVSWSQRRKSIRNKLSKEGIGQYVEKWRIKNRLFSPNPKTLEKSEEKSNRNESSSQKQSRKQE